MSDADALETVATHGEPANLTSKYGRLSLTDKARILLLNEEGLTQVDIAQDIGCSQSAVSHTLATFKQKEDVLSLLLVGKLEDRIAHWDEAEKQASKRGDHRPTKERLEMAMPKLRPQPIGAHNHGGVTVIVALPGGDQHPRPAITVSAVGQTAALSPSVSSDLHKLSD